MELSSYFYKVHFFIYFWTWTTLIQGDPIKFVPSKMSDIQV